MRMPGGMYLHQTICHTHLSPMMSDTNGTQQCTHHQALPAYAYPHTSLHHLRRNLKQVESTEPAHTYNLSEIHTQPVSTAPCTGSISDIKEGRFNGSSSALGGQCCARDHAGTSNPPHVTIQTCCAAGHRVSNSLRHGMSGRHKGDQIHSCCWSRNMHVWIQTASAGHVIRMSGSRQYRKAHKWHRSHCSAAAERLWTQHTA
jgi:hypothetical protein